jgi:outer membrane protein, heavy metal efflux system
MPLIRKARLCAFVAVTMSGGCQSPQMRGVPRAETPCNIHATADRTERETKLPALAKVSYDEPVSGGLGAGQPDVKSQTELSAERLVEEVEVRNPTLEALTAAWRAAAQRYPQVVSLDDPMFMAMVAPASFDSDTVNPGYTLQASQKFPWFGKRAIRGRQAQAGARAAFFDLEDGRVSLSAIARAAYYEYYLAHRQLELNQQNVDVILQLRKTAQSRYEANQVTQQDVLQAEVELATLERRGIELERMKKVARARINTLLREDPMSELPPPRQQLDSPSNSFDVSVLQQLALSQRPDLAALSARVRADQAAVALAGKDYYPDTELFGQYNAIMQQEPLQPAVGVKLNVPIYVGRLDAAVREKRFALSRRRAELEQRILDVQYEVANAYEQVDENRRLLTLYDTRLVPAAEQNVAAARVNYDVSKTSFFDLAGAERQLISLQEEREQVLANYHTHLAELRRAVGGSIASTGEIDDIPPPK